MGKNQSLIQPYPLILASTSTYRKALMDQLGFVFEAINPEVNEDQYKKLNYSPTDLALELSKLKAMAISKKRPEACVIGSDQVCHIEGEILGKPLSMERACEQLASMQGRAHELITAVTMIAPEEMLTFVNKTKLYMRPLTKQQIENYVNHDLPLDCAGSYKLESKGITLFEKIEMDDHTAIIGLPLIQLTNSLLKLGYVI
jgi:septum formation protein